MQSDFFSKFGQIQNGMSDGLNNLSQVMEKTEEIFSQLSTYNMSVRLLDMSAWQPVINQLATMGNNSMIMEQFGSPESLIEMVLEMLNMFSPEIAEEIIPLYKQAISLANIGLDLSLQTLNNEILSRLPTVQMLTELLNELPELMETLVFTNSREPFRMYMQMSQVDSFQSFCKIDPDNLFMKSPNSTWDSRNWMSKLCMFNESNVMGEIFQHPAAYQLGMIMNGTYMGQDNITQVIEKVFAMMSQLESGNIPALSMMRLLDPSVWDPVIYQLSSVSMDNIQFGSPESYTDMIFGVFNMVAPEIAGEVMSVYKQAVSIANIALNICLEVLKSNTLPEAFNGYPSIQMMSSLVSELPEMMATLIYTNNKEPQRMYMLLSQVDSFQAFCEIDPDNLFIKSPNSTWDSRSWMSKLCMFNETVAFGELMQHPAVYRIAMVMNGTFMGLDNVTQVIGNIEMLIGSLEAGFPLMSDRLFDPSAWEQVLEVLTMPAMPQMQME